MIDVFEVSEFASESFDTLKARLVPGTSVMPAAWIPGRTDALFALSESEDFYLLVSLSQPLQVAERRLNALRLSSGGVYTLSSNDDEPPLERSFATIALEHGNAELITAFGTLAGVLLGALSEAPTRDEIVGFLDDFVDLFAAKRSVERSSVVGLWGELWLMRQAVNPLCLAQGWHVDANARFDFSLDRLRIEVKTTERALRVHRFSLAQLERQSKPTWIASIAIVADPSGLSISELLSELIQLLPPPEKSNVARKALKVVAGDIEATSDFRFAPNGLNPLALVGAETIPRVIVPNGAAISEVAFTIDITQQCLGAQANLEELLP